MRRWIRPTLPLLALTTLATGCPSGDDSPPADGTGTETDATGSTTNNPPADSSTTRPDDTTTSGPDSTSTEDSTTGGTDTTTGGEDPTVFLGPTKGGPIAVSPDESRLAVVNSGSGELTILTLPELEEETRMMLVGEPESLSFSPTGEEIFVVLRGEGMVVRVSGVGGIPSVDGTVDVGAEPGRAALSPTGALLWVPLWGEGYVVTVDTATMTVTNEIETGGSPYATCITNDEDDDENDETVFVTDFYGAPVAGELEATDGAREGRVFSITPGNGFVNEVRLPVLANSGTNGFEATGAYPNQLYSCAIHDDVLYVTSVGASPASFNNGTDFHQNVQGLVHRVPLTGGGDPDVIDLNALIDDIAAPKRFLPVPSDIAFATNGEVGYITSLVSDSVLRVDFAMDPPVAGSPGGASFLTASQSPIGVAIVDSDMYVANEVARSTSHIDLSAQVTVIADIETATMPGNAADLEVLEGQRFFNTGLGRWSTNGWVSCVACHPFGTTDNITWSFPAGPRQTVDTAASFNAGATEQRIFNWTAIFDEVHDFELNTRGVAGGTGAIVNDTTLNANGTANVAAQIDLGNAATPINAFNIGSARAVSLLGATPDEWEAIQAYMGTLRSPHGATRLDGDAESGRVVFEDAGCNACHAGPLWTLSRRYYTPAFNPNDGTDLDERLLSLFSVGVPSTGNVRPEQLPSTDTNVLTVLSNDANGAPARHTCVTRIVGTFDADGPSGRGAAEIRQNGTAAQGPSGFNVPSLLGVGRGAPFLHNGAAESLEELLDPAGDFVTHLQAGNQLFAPTPQDLADLIAFVNTIDDSTETFPIDPLQDICPVTVPQ
jgi:YVTN family beta-propeller protein